MAKVPYNKPALSIDQQLDLLEARGMDVGNRNRAAYYLRFIGYYRLSGYWFPFQHRDGSEIHDDFHPGTTFDAVLSRYIFDRRLRVLIMDATERIEVAARSAISNTMSEKHGSHWYCDAAFFDVRFDHGDFMVRTMKEAGIRPWRPANQAEFIQNYIRKYSPEEPPSWMAFELLPFGTVSMVFKWLHEPDKKAIADQFNLPRDRLASWLHAASHIRNVAAHHNRLWNREFRIQPTIDKAERHHVLEPKRFYNHAVSMQTLLKRISGSSHWGDRLASLIEEYPTVPLGPMGCPENWRDQSIWL